MTFFSELALNKRAWLTLAISALAFELTALYFQYVMGFEPCIMCIYQRVAIWGVFIAGVIGYIAPQQLIVRIMAFALWGTSSIYGVMLALEHVEMQSSAMSLFFTCDLFPNFPTWAPLHEWVPFLFEATGDCGKISWQFLDYSMPQWMVVIFGAYSLVFISVLISRIFIAKNL